VNKKFSTSHRENTSQACNRDRWRTAGDRTWQRETFASAGSSGAPTNS